MNEKISAIEKPDFFEAIRKTVRNLFGIPPIPSEIVDQYRKAASNLSEHYGGYKEIVMAFRENFPNRKTEIPWDPPTELVEAWKNYETAREKIRMAERIFLPGGRFWKKDKK